MKKLVITGIVYGKEIPVMGVIGNDSAIVNAVGKRATKLINKGFKMIHSDNTSMIYAHDIVDTQYKFCVTM
jgi:hypothetical protein